MLTPIDPSMFKFIFDSARLGWFGSANILQIAADRVSPFELSSCCSCHVFSYYFAWFLLETSEMSPFIVLKTKTTQSRLQVFSVNGALTCKKAARHRFIKRKILPNLVISS